MTTENQVAAPLQVERSTIRHDRCECPRPVVDRGCMSQAHSNNLKQRQTLGLVTHDNTGGPFVIECQGCGLVYPSFQCAGGGQIADTGDFDNAYCPHCQQVDPDECENVGLAWNTQQLKINALLDVPAPRAEFKKIEMAHVLNSLEDVRGKPVLTSNQCHDLARALNDRLLSPLQLLSMPPEYLAAAQARGERISPVSVALPDLEASFATWWETDGQYCRAGGGHYEKTFAYRAYEAALKEVTRLNTK